MSSEQRSLEIQGDTVERAIDAGLKQLGLTRDEVAIQVIDEGSSGFLGLGSRSASVRLTVKAEPEAEQPGDPRPAPALTAEPPDEDAVEPAETMPLQTVTTEEDLNNEDKIAYQIVSTLLEKMQIDATAVIEQTEPDDLTGERRWIISITGKDLGALIGPRGETLNAMQYVARQIAGHAVGHRPTFIIDVDGYRTRREQALTRLAERMADKAVKQGRPLSLEPMPPNERRIIHITLRDDDRVDTESSGEGGRRRVRIFPKR